MIVGMCAVFGSGCAAIESHYATSHKETITAPNEPTRQISTHKSQKTQRAEAKYVAGRALCTLQSKNHTKQQVLLTLPPPIVVENGVIRQLPEAYRTVVNNPQYGPFDMLGCMAEMARYPWERVALLAVSKTADLLTLGAKGYAAVKLAKEVLNRDSLVVEGDGNKVNAGDGAFDYVESKDGIPLNPVDGEPITFSSPTEEEVVIDEEVPEL